MEDGELSVLNETLPKKKYLAINEFGFRRIWRIKQIEEGVIHRSLLAMFLAIVLPCSSCSSYSSSEWSVRHFSFHKENNSISSPGLLG